MRVYLAGKITGLTYKQCTTWRKEASMFLAEHGISSYDPLRGKDELSSLGSKKISANSESTLHGPMNTPRAIMTRDYIDCIRADAILVNLSFDTSVSAGTMMEIAWAYHLKIPVVAIIPKDSFYLQHPMVSEALSVICETVEEGVFAVAQLLQN